MNALTPPMCSHITNVGTTLIELLVTIGIAAMFAAVTLFNAQDWAYQNRRSDYIEQLYTHLFAARSYAIFNNHYVSVCPAIAERCVPNWQNNIIVFVDRNNDKQRGGDEPILNILTVPIGNDTIDYPRRAVTFKPTGALGGFQSGSFVYCSVEDKLNQPAYRITVSQTGRLRIKQDSDKC